MNNQAELFRFALIGQESDNEPVYDIFSGTPEENALWLETLIGPANARNRMEEVAECGNADHVFVYSRANQRVVCETLWN